MKKYISIIKDTAEEMLVELKKYESVHPKINAVFIKGDKTNLLPNFDFTDVIPPMRYGMSLEL